MAKNKIQKKEVRFQGQKLVLYSLDGVTWSTNKDELEIILNRLELQKAGLNEKLGKAVEAEVEPETETKKELKPKKKLKLKKAA